MSRPKEFVPDEALDKAMQVFWRNGSEATSMEDLLSAMDLNCGSLFDPFDDTRQPFLKVMDRHCHGFVGETFSLLDQPSPALPTLRRNSQGMIEGGLADPHRRGCLIANTGMELSPHEQEIAGTVSQPLKMAEDPFVRVLPAPHSRLNGTMIKILVRWRAFSTR
jgi:TetR/AcrR family transcriptional repressor of nem operon